MAVVPQIKSLTNVGKDVLNAIRNSASQLYKDYVPIATDAPSIRKIGAIIMDYADIYNEFCGMVNRIGLVYVKSRSYDNPLAIFKKGFLEYGEIIEESWINLLEAHQFDIDTAEKEVFKREYADIDTAFHYVNYKKFYKVTIERQQVKSAFLSENGVIDLIDRIINQLVTSMNYDEFTMMRYLIARHIIDNHFKIVNIAGTDTHDNMLATVTKIKATSNALEFMSNEYNPVGVYNYATKGEQYLFMTAEFNAINDVNVLASAFNMDKAEFLGHQFVIPSFGDFDTKRLDKLMENDPTYKSFTPDEISKLNSVQCVLVDKDYFMVYDREMIMENIRNPQGLYYNYFLHTWKAFSVSPFSNAICFSKDLKPVSSVNSSEFRVYNDDTGELLVSDAESNNFPTGLPVGTRLRFEYVGNAVPTYQIDIEADDYIKITNGNIGTITKAINAGTQVHLTLYNQNGETVGSFTLEGKAD